MTIERLEAIPLRLPFLGTFVTSQGTVGETGRGAEHVLVRVQADDGTVGWGECRPSRHWSDETLETVVSTINRYFAPALRGRKLVDFAGHDAAMSGAIARGFSLGQPIARTGVDLALWDLLGRSLGVPLQTLFGGTAQRSIKLSWTVTGKDEAELVASVEEGWRRGYQDFNFKLGFGLATDRRIARTIAALAPDAFLWADANGGYSLEQAVVASRDLAAVGVQLLEQPLPSNRYADYPLLRQKSALPIGIDEGLLAPDDLIQLLRLDAIDVFVLKLGRMGGLRRARQALEIAAAAGLRCLGSGLTESDLMLAAYAHLLSAYGIETPNALNGRQFLGDQWVTGLEGAGDTVPVPTGPGLGVEVDLAKVEEYRVELSFTVA